jgi:hypothetical protein
MKIQIDMKTWIQMIGFSFLLSAIFTVMKVLELVDWSWLWVWSPTWIMMGVFLVMLIAFLIFVMMNKDLFDTMDKD